MSAAPQTELELDERPGDTLGDRWGDLSPTAKGGLVTFASVLVLLVAYLTPGLGTWLDEKAPLGIVVAGAVIGTVTALLAMGLILIYRTNRFINFAYGAMGSFAGVIAIGLHIAQGVNFFVALPIGVTAGVLTGLLVDMIIRRFQNASRLVVTVASIGIAQILAVIEFMTATHLLNFVSLTGGFNIPLDVSVSLPAKTLMGDEILIMLAVPPVLAFLAWFLLKTDAGIGVRAAAENSDRALLLGIPIKRLSTIVWAIAGGLAALTYILKAPFSGVTPGLATASAVVLLPALAAAVVARMESLPIAFAAGVVMGIIEQVVRWNTTGSPTMQNMVFLVVILGALLLQRGKLSRAVEGVTSSWSSTGVLKPIPEELRRVPEVLWTKRVLFLVLAAAFVFIPATWAPSNQMLGALALVWAMTAVSLVVLTGWGGHISLGQFAIVGVGALATANLVSRYNVDLFLSLIAAGTAGAIIALLVGLPALRIKGLFLAVTTLAFAVALDTYIINPQNFGWMIPGRLERPMLFERFDLENSYTMYLFCLVFLVLSILVAQGVRKARSGRVIIATRDNEKAADAASVPTTGTKLMAFVLAGVIAGVAGGLHVMLIRELAEGSYPAYFSLDLFATAVIGGLGSIAGALTGVLVFQWIASITALGDIRPFITGGVLLIVLLVVPGGLGQLLYTVRDRFLRRVADARGILVPSLFADKREGSDQPEDETGLLANALSDSDDNTPADTTAAGASR